MASLLQGRVVTDGTAFQILGELPGGGGVLPIRCRSLGSTFFMPYDKRAGKLIGYAKPTARACLAQLLPSVAFMADAADQDGCEEEEEAPEACSM